MKKGIGILIVLLLLMSGGFSEGADYITIESVFSDVSLDGAEEIRVDKDGKYAYIVSYHANAFSVFDVSDPTNPQYLALRDNSNNELNDTDLFTQALGLAVSGRYAYVVTNTTTTGSNKFVVIDITDPNNPSVVGKLNGSGGRNIVVDGKYAYVAGYKSGNVYIIDISDPTAPSLEATIDNSMVPDFDNVYAIAKQNRYIYVVSDTTGSNDLFAIIDVADLQNLQLKDVYNPNSGTVEDDMFDRPVGIVVKGKYAYVSTMSNTLDKGKSLFVFNVDDPTNIIVQGKTYLEWSIYRAGAEGLFSVDEKYAYVPVWNWFNNGVALDMGGLAVVDISDPALPVVDVLGADRCSGQAYEVCGYIYCTSFRNGELNILGASNLP